MNAIEDKLRGFSEYILQRGTFKFSRLESSRCSRDEAKRNRGCPLLVIFVRRQREANRHCERNEVERGNPET
jgi:hypothetical protein